LPLFILTLACVCLSFAARAGLPSTNEVAKYERYTHGENKWFEISKSDGDTILYCLRDIDNFERPKPPPPEVISVKWAPLALTFRVIGVDGGTNNVWFGSASVGFGMYDNRIIPEAERATLSQLFNAWKEADKKRILSQPLPCQFRIGSIEDSGTLSAIAKLFYGDASKWPAIWEANKNIIKNPHAVDRQLITIPKLED